MLDLWVGPESLAFHGALSLPSLRRVGANLALELNPGTHQVEVPSFGTLASEYIVTFRTSLWSVLSCENIAGQHVFCPFLCVREIRPPLGVLKNVSTGASSLPPAIFFSISTLLESSRSYAPSTLLSLHAPSSPLLPVRALVPISTKMCFLLGTCPTGPSSAAQSAFFALARLGSLGAYPRTQVKAFN